MALKAIGKSRSRGAQDARIAGQVQADAAMAGVEETRRQFDITQANLRPRFEAGNQALAQQQALLGMSGAAAQAAAFEAFEDSPGQRFIRERAQRGLVRNSSAIGGLGGGNVRSALVEQGAGFAAQDYANQFNRLGAISSGGQVAGQDMAQFGANASQNIVGGIQQAGAARASGILGARKAKTDFDNSILSFGGALAGGLSDRRLKRDIEKIDEDEIGGIYHFRYNDNDQLFKGRMADELQKTRPDDVIELPSGYLAVSKEFAPEEV